MAVTPTHTGGGQVRPRFGRVPAADGGQGEPEEGVARRQGQRRGGGRRRGRGRGRRGREPGEQARRLAGRHVHDHHQDRKGNVNVGCSVA